MGADDPGLEPGSDDPTVLPVEPNPQALSRVRALIQNVAIGVERSMWGNLR
ncbi:hypothetical protein HMPREF0290_0652 [Corynebacterium efficiens YS-314]|nr:hypothetical protein HMPREF0290_0652 [Corynebacterium efficiens YS-314]